MIVCKIWLILALLFIFEILHPSANLLKMGVSLHLCCQCIMVSQNAKMILSVCDLQLAHFLDFQITYDGVTYDGALGIYLNFKKRICLIKSL